MIMDTHPRLHSGVEFQICCVEEVVDLNGDTPATHTLNVEAKPAQGGNPGGLVETGYSGSQWGVVLVVQKVILVVQGVVRGVQVGHLMGQGFI